MYWTTRGAGAAPRPPQATAWQLGLRPWRRRREERGAKCAERAPRSRCLCAGHSCAPVACVRVCGRKSRAEVVRVAHGRRETKTRLAVSAPSDGLVLSAVPLVSPLRSCGAARLGKFGVATSPKLESRAHFTTAPAVWPSKRGHKAIWHRFDALNADSPLLNTQID